ncbi:disease resistance protein RPP4-like [Prosopis cineraria]|uniref:disease resistance protein RPP4-like n=1 Tax=Prosopis cineraria TaxID=364024 RepID=UPI00240FE396|nr:disease resistance protein RPP4-like [Prosopis cineraria]
MQHSNIKKLWDGVQDLVNLKMLDLRRSRQLMELPDFSMACNLEEVNLEGCESLHSVHPSILSLQSLVGLDVSDCRELESLESETHLESLSDLGVHNCQASRNSLYHQRNWEVCVSMGLELKYCICYQWEVSRN